MNQRLRRLLALFSAILIIKLILLLLIPAPSAFSDEYIYAKTAWSVFHEQSYAIHSIPSNSFPPLYSLLLSIAFFFSSKMQTIYLIMKILNAIISASIIFPTFFLAKEFLDEKKSFLASFIIAILPPNLLFTTYLMSENLLFPLLMLYLLLIYKAFTTQHMKYFVFASIVGAFCFLTRSIAIALFISPAVIWFLQYRSLKTAKKIALHYLLLAVLILPWLIRNAITFTSTQSILRYSEVFSNLMLNSSSLLPSFINWMLLYSGYLLLAASIPVLATLFYKKTDKNYKTILYSTISIAFIVLILAANHSSRPIISYSSPFAIFTYRPIGRYIETALSPLVLTGFIALSTGILQKNKIKIYSIIALILGIISTQLTISPLFPPNNHSLALFGAAKEVLNKIFYTTAAFSTPIFLILMFSMIAYLIISVSSIYYKKFELPLLMLFLILTNIIAFSAAWYNTTTYWYSNPQNQLGLWLDNNIRDPKATFLFDKRDCTEKYTKFSSTICDPDGVMALAAFWLNAPVKISSIEDTSADYIISRHQLDLKEITKSSDGIFVYKTE